MLVQKKRIATEKKEIQSPELNWLDLSMTEGEGKPGFHSLFLLAIAI